MTKYTNEFSSLFNHINRMAVGFEPLLKDIETNIRFATNTYPPHNVIMKNENEYNIEFAIAGFKKDEITLEVIKSTLVVEGDKGKVDSEDKNSYLFHGISNRSFKKSFNLADNVKVVDAGLEDGILSIKLVKEIPEEEKAQKIVIK